jgi:hypothetical protein
MTEMMKSVLLKEVFKHPLRDEEGWISLPHSYRLIYKVYPKKLYSFCLSSKSGG